MNYLIGFILFTTLIANAQASIDHHDLCRKLASDYSNEISQRQQASFNEACVQLALKNFIKMPKLAVSNDHLSLEIYANENYLVLFDDKNRSRKIYAGNKTQLNNIISVTISHDGEFIGVINESPDEGKEILVFKTTHSGNIFPNRVIRRSGLEGIDSIFFHSEAEEKKPTILAFNSTKQTLMHIDMKTDARSPAQESVKHEYRAVFMFDFDHQIDFAHVYENDLYLLSNHTIHAYDINLPKEKMWTLDLSETELLNPSRIHLTSLGNVLEVYDQNGDIIRFSKD